MGTLKPGGGTGGSGIENVVEDTSPQLGGNLDINGNKIVSTSNGDIDIEPAGTGNVLLGNFTFNADQSVGAGQDNYVLTYDNSAGTISLEAAAAGGLSNVVEDTTPQLGGQLDVNGNAIGDGTRELITFTEDASAVNHVNIENEATGSGPIISAAGDDTNVDLNINAKGTGNIAIGNYTFDADQTVGAGQDNYVLTYDNSGGLISLEEAAGGAGGDVGYFSIPPTGKYMGPCARDDALFNGTLTADTLYAAKIVISSDMSVDRASIIVNTAAGGTSCRLGLYEESNGQPGALVTDFGTVSSATTGNKEITISQTITAGRYFVAVVSDGGPGLHCPSVSTALYPLTYVESLGNGTGPTFFSVSHTFGALPDPFGTPTVITTNTLLPNVYFRKA